MLKKRKLSRFIRNKEKFVLFKKYSKNLRNGDPSLGNWKNKKQKPSENRENLRNGSLRFITVSYRKGLRIR